MPWTRKTPSGNSAGSLAGSGQRLTDHRSGRICPQTGAPAIECGGGCGSEDCTYRKVPDKVLTDGMERLGRMEDYSKISFPKVWEEARDFDWAEATRDALTRIMPETGIGAAFKYLGMARFALFISRALESIKKGGFSDQRILVENVLRDQEVETDSALEEARRNVSRGGMGREELDYNILRFKTVYALRQAQGSI